MCEHRWVHVLCAITVLEARFVNITERSPIDLSAIPLPRFRLVRLAFLLYLLHSRLVYLLTYSSNSLPNCGLRSGCTDVTAAVWSSLQVPHVGYIFMLNHCWFLLEVLLNVIWLRWSQCVVFATVSILCLELSCLHPVSSFTFQTSFVKIRNQTATTRHRVICEAHNSWPCLYCQVSIWQEVLPIEQEHWVDMMSEHQWLFKGSHGIFIEHTWLNCVYILLPFSNIWCHLHPSCLTCFLSHPFLPL